jgi:hypothetical protein
MMNEICNIFQGPGILCILRTYKYHVSCRHSWFPGQDGLRRVSNICLDFSFYAKGFEFIADLNNWGKLKPSQDEFVNLFII